jgi:hypothetical protein
MLDSNLPRLNPITAQQLKTRVKSLIDDEVALFRKLHPKSLAAHERAKKVLPLGVASSLQVSE